MTYNFGSTKESCLYDAAVSLSMILDSVPFDQSSDGYNALHTILCDMWDALPVKVVIDLSGD